MKSALETLIAEVTIALAKKGIRHALAGGFAASLYRTNARVTLDLDLAVDVKPHEAKQVSDIIEDQRMILSRATLGQLQGAPRFVWKRSPVAVVSGTGKSGKVDFLLASLPWVSEAVKRAQLNQIDIDGHKLPVLLPEDLVVAKLVSLKNNPSRVKDIDDIQEILSSSTKLDTQYLAAQIRAHGLTIPETLRISFTDIGLDILLRQRRRPKR